MVPHTHRPQMPYSFQGVNATYINAYAFPGGSIAATRGILLSLKSEAELSSLLGHELGHVNARHTAQQMSKGDADTGRCGGNFRLCRHPWGCLRPDGNQLGMYGAGALLASYSRDNEREADQLGMTYMTRSGYGSEGFVNLMAMLNSLHKGNADAVSLLFSTHPMSQERYDAAVDMKNNEFSSFASQPLHQERYMDHTADLRKLKPAIELFQKAEESMARKAFDQAEASFDQGLKLAPTDYAGLVMMAKCQMMQKKYDRALQFSEKAKQVYPQEAQANHLSGLAEIRLKKFDQAVADFTAYEKKLPGNPNTIFYRGYAYEGMGNKQKSADDYYRYLQQVTEGDQAQHAYQRLVQWGALNLRANEIRYLSASFEIRVRATPLWAPC